MWWSGAWNNVTSDVLVRDGVEVVRGRTAEDASSSPAECRFSLKNADSKYSPRNSSSPLYGLIGRNTPVRVGVGRPPVAAVGVDTGTSMTAPAVTAEVTGLQLVAYASSPAANFTMPGGFTAGTEQDGSNATFRAAYKSSVAAGSTGTAVATASTSVSWSAVNVHIPGGVFDVSYSGVSTSGNDRNTTVPGYASGDTLVAVCGWSSDPDNAMQPPKAEGDLGVGWSLLADTGAGDGPRLMVWVCKPVGDPGEVSLVGKRDGAGDAYLAVYVLSDADDWWPRFCGEIAEFPQRWAKGSSDVWVPVRAAGVSRRVAASTDATSAVETSLRSRPELVAYWPLTDDGVSAFSSGVPGGAPMAFAADGDDPGLQGYSGFAGSLPVATFNDAGAIGYVVNPGTSALWGGGALVHIPDNGAAAGANLITLEFQGGTISALVVEYTSSTSLTRKVIYNDGTSTTTGTTDWSSIFPDGFVGARMLLFFRAEQSGADVPWAYTAVNLDDPDGVVATVSGTASSATLGSPVRFSVGTELATAQTLHTTPVAFGHAFVMASTTLQSTDPDLGEGSIRAFYGWTDNKTTDRVFRLCRSAGVKVCVPHNDTDTAMGVQSVAPLWDLLLEAETAGAGGRLVDAAGFPGLWWRGRVSKEAQAAKLTFSLTGSQVHSADPTDDDLLTVNDVTVERLDGGSARATDDTSIAALGRYAKRYEVSLHDPGDAAQHASWQLHFGTVDEMRWPELTVTWERNSGQQDEGGLLQIGDVIELDDVPTWAGGGSTRLVVEGYRDEVTDSTWRTTYVLVPAAPWDVMRWGADDARWDTWGDDGSSPPIYWGL